MLISILEAEDAYIERLKNVMVFIMPVNSLVSVFIFNFECFHTTYLWACYNSINSRASRSSMGVEECL